MSTVVQQHPCDRSVSHGHVFQFSTVQLRIPRGVPMIHGEYVDGHGGVATSSLELVHHGPVSCLHQGSGDIRVCLDHIGIVLWRLQSKRQSNSSMDGFFINMLVSIDD